MTDKTCEYQKFSEEVFLQTNLIYCYIAAFWFGLFVIIYLSKEENNKHCISLYDQGQYNFNLEMDFVLQQILGIGQQHFYLIPQRCISSCFAICRCISAAL